MSIKIGLYFAFEFFVKKIKLTKYSLLKLFFNDKNSDLSIWQGFCCKSTANQKYCYLFYENYEK